MRCGRRALERAGGGVGRGQARNPGVASFEGVALNTRGRMTSDLDIIAASADTLAQSPRPTLRALGGASYGEALLAQGDRASGLAQLDLQSG